jgi:excisionase family DNA binding protein
VRGEPLSAAEILEQIASDPSVLAALRAILGASRRPEVPAYTVATLAATLGVTERVVRNAIGRGELAAVKRGARWLISPDAVDAWAHGDGNVSRKTRRFAQSRQPLTSAFAQMGDGAQRSA